MQYFNLFLSKRRQIMNVKDELTKQEENVLALLAQGLRTAAIAKELFISPRTVETHLRHIFEKLGVSSRTEAAVYALHARLVVSIEVSRNPDDMLDDKSYPYGNEASDFTRTLVRKGLV
jgi:DNA-binding CsgD family transcriptional regulator